CILGEPTNPASLGDMIKIGRRGSLSAVITVEGRQGHVAYPHLAANPIPALLAILARLTDKPLDAGTEHFDPSNLVITSIEVGN
ncbi:peptidase dimerization domain-containing protein, partial [Acinetobacter nosocomialis]|uniref:peptidase dimerization domain-containing protein n=1 Tax=Acinetobacter nosocomialis TaxID=106654 RepID=UPI0013D36E9B